MAGWKPNQKHADSRMPQEDSITRRGIWARGSPGAGTGEEKGGRACWTQPEPGPGGLAAPASGAAEGAPGRKTDSALISALPLTVRPSLSTGSGCQMEVASHVAVPDPNSFSLAFQITQTAIPCMDLETHWYNRHRDRCFHVRVFMHITAWGGR